jgi:DNA-binding transcriptional LysR family regulator
MAVVGAPSYFVARPEPKSPKDLVNHTCINFRQPSAGGLHAWEFEKRGRELRVRVTGQLVFNRIAPLLTAARAGFGLAYLTDDLVEEGMAADGSDSRGGNRKTAPVSGVTHANARRCDPIWTIFDDRDSRSSALANHARRMAAHLQPR